MSSPNDQQKSINAYFHRAQGTSNASAPQVTISIHDELNVDAASLEELKEIYQGEGKWLCNLLFGSLPGGTIDQLMIEMLKRKASMLGVYFGDTGD